MLTKIVSKMFNRMTSCPIAGEFLSKREENSLTTCSLMLPSGGSSTPTVVFIRWNWGGEGGREGGKKGGREERREGRKEGGKGKEGGKEQEEGGEGKERKEGIRKKKKEKGININIR